MITSIKSLNVIGILVILLLTSCKKDDNTPSVITTYRLSLNAATAPEGNTVFSTITYNNANGTTETLNNTTSVFSESFEIAIGYTILFNVSGTNDGTNQTTPRITYTVEKFENNVNRGIICFGSSVGIAGSQGSWSFTSTNTSTFDGSSCN